MSVGSRNDDGANKIAEKARASRTRAPTMIHAPLICAAIRSRTLVEFEYGGHGRVVAPYIHGTSASGEALRAVQVAGTSSSGLSSSGKLWLLSRMKNVRATPHTFVASDPDYNPDDAAMRSIHCRI